MEARNMKGKLLEGGRSSCNEILDKFSSGDGAGEGTNIQGDVQREQGSEMRNSVGKASKRVFNPGF